MKARRPADIEAEIQFLTAAEGGRKTACRSPSGEYRPTGNFGVEGAFNDVLCEFIGKEWVSPGEATRTRLWFLAPQFQSGRLQQGFKFTLHEGRRLVATGEVTSVLNSALLKTDNR